MKRAIVVTMLIASMVVLTGCSSNPFRGLRRGAQCAPKCGQNVVAPSAPSTGTCNCGSQAVQVYDPMLIDSSSDTIIVPPSNGVIPPPPGPVSTR